MCLTKLKCLTVNPIDQFHIKEHLIWRQSWWQSGLQWFGSILQVLHEQALGKASFFAPYISVLPSTSQMQHIPLLAGPAVTKEIQYEPLVQAITEQRQWLEDFACNELRVVQQQCRDLFQGRPRDFAAIGKHITTSPSKSPAKHVDRTVGGTA